MMQEVRNVGSNVGDSVGVGRSKKNLAIKAIVISLFVIALTFAAISVFSISRNLSESDCSPGEYNKDGRFCVFDIDAMIVSENVYSLSGGEFIECPDELAFNENSGLCETPVSSLVCEEGDYNSEDDICEYSPDVSFVCEEGDYNSEDDVCEVAPETIYECAGELQEVDGVTSCVVGFSVLEAACGDGVCDEFEKVSGVCSSDCVGTLFCGDGICGDSEKLFCELDCGEIVHPCGDGICDEKELADSGLCPGDCEVEGFVGSEYYDSPFGFHYASKLEDYVADLGVKWVRVNAVWDIVQKERDIVTGNFNWDAFEDDSKISSYPEGTNFMITFSVLGTPIAQGDSYVLHDGTYSKENWIKFTKAVVDRYKDRVKYFQVENEPKPTKKHFAELQKITYIAVKEECSECQVVIGGFFWGKGLVEEYDMLNLKNLQELNGNYVDIYDQHYYGNTDEYNPKTLLDHAKIRLAETNFGDIPIWITEMGDYSGDPNEAMRMDPPYQSEADQSGSLLKRYVSSLSYGVEKIFWAYGLYEGYYNDETYFDFTGLIYDGKYEHDLGHGVKKLGYYSYKLMTQKLEGSDWGNIEIIQESNDIYVVRFTNKETGEFTWVAWSDLGSGSVTLSSLGLSKAKVTEAVPNYENGLEVEGVAFEDMFRESVVSGSVVLGDVPVFIEESGSVVTSDYEDSPFGILDPIGTNIAIMKHFGFSLDEYHQWEADAIKETNIQYGRKNNLLLWELHEPELDGNYVWDYYEPGFDTDAVLKIVYDNVWNDFNLVLAFNPSRGKSVAYIGSDFDMEMKLQNFIEAAVERYDGDGVEDYDSSIKVKYWQAENEPFIFNAWIDEKGGSVESYARYVELLSQSVKKADPEAKIVLGGAMTPEVGPEVVDVHLRNVIKLLKNKNVFDIVDIHYWKEASNYKMDIATDMRKLLDENGYSYVEIWSCEHGTYVNDPVGNLPYQSELDQGISFIKRYSYNLAHDVDKIFWNKFVDFDCFNDRCGGIYDNIGLISDGANSGETEETRGVKRLVYYSHVFFSQKLEGSDWGNIKIVQESNDIYVYKFTNKETGKFTWVAWSDSGSGSVSLDLLGLDNAKVVEAVPDYDNGLEVEGVAFEDMFRESFVSGSVELGDVPVFIEGE